MNNRHQHIPRRKAIQPSNKLAQSAPEGHEREENRRRGLVAPPMRDVGGGDPGAACEAGEAEGRGGGDRLKEDCYVWLGGEQAVDFFVVVGLEGHCWEGWGRGMVLVFVCAAEGR